ncbi:protein C18orf63 [Nibea albiflora]|uniref:Protein C18orf63 n=1 Tax=Nibea albiflora TaxID=240163 RepID=A0ACB7F6A7_NIBAL|nr:protein C18orf63 [Nibea albiflora]
MSGAVRRAVFFLGLPDLNSLVCITVSLQEDDDLRSKQMKTCSYPLSCIRLQPVQRCPPADLQGALGSFLSDIRGGLRSVCGFPARLTSKPSHHSVSLSSAATGQGVVFESKPKKSRSAARDVDVEQMARSNQVRRPYSVQAELCDSAGLAERKRSARQLQTQEGGADAEGHELFGRGLSLTHTHTHTHTHTLSYLLNGLHALSPRRYQSESQSAELHQTASHRH